MPYAQKGDLLCLVVHIVDSAIVSYPDSILSEPPRSFLHPFGRGSSFKASNASLTLSQVPPLRRSRSFRALLVRRSRYTLASIGQILVEIGHRLLVPSGLHRVDRQL